MKAPDGNKLAILNALNQGALSLGNYLVSNLALVAPQ